MLKRNILVDRTCPGLQEFKSHIRITSSEMDADLRSKLLAAIMAAEKTIGEVIAFSRYTLSSCFASVIRFPVRPISDIVSVEVDGVEVDSTKYDFDGRVLSFDEDVAGEKMEIVFNAGREDTEADIKAAILLHAAALFNNPVDSVETLPKASFNLLRPYRHWDLED